MIAPTSSDLLAAAKTTTPPQMPVDGSQQPLTVVWVPAFPGESAASVARRASFHMERGQQAAVMLSPAPQPQGSVTTTPDVVRSR